ncbi:MAG TPA: DUF5804 family protein [Halobacteriales archaeon]|nr:DUF5804 family protein [Halobacteriales archaeon]
MTRVCLVGAEDATLPEDLLSYPTARDALDSYRLEEPYENAVAVETISIGAAVSLLNDLDWYLVRLVSEALVLEPSVSEDEWLSRKLATTVRNETVEPEDTGTFLKIYGVVSPDEVVDGDSVGPPVDDADGEIDDFDGPESGHAGDATPPSAGRRPRLAEPLYAQRVDGEVPAYDLREVEDTLVVRVTAEEFGA